MLNILRSDFLSGLQLTLAKKIPIMIVGAAAIAAVSQSVVGYLNATSSLQEATGSKLSAVVESRNEALSHYLESIRADLRFQADNPLVRAALGEFMLGWQSITGDRTERLQRLYIEDNPHPTGQKHHLDSAQDGSVYSEAHARYHPWMRQFLSERGYYDIFLFDPAGNLVYTVFKELDYATNLDSGPWAKTDLGNAFRAARDNPVAHHQAFFDFKSYAPSHGAPASFISTPILGHSGELMGVLVFQMPIGELNRVLQATDGLGETGETFMVGEDYLMRSDSRLATESTILNRKVETLQSRGAIAGETGVIETSDYRGINVLAAYTPVDFMGTRWGLVAEQETVEAFAAIGSLRAQLLIQGAIILAVLTGLGMLAAGSITRPVINLTTAMRKIADGHLGIEVPALDRRDEIGGIALAFQDNAARIAQLNEQQADLKKQSETEKHLAMMALADDFEAKVGHVVQGVTASATELQATAESLSAISEETSVQSTTVASASELALANVENVATAAKELGGSIGEISQQVQRQADMAAEAASAAETSNSQVLSLAERADSIGEVVNLITGIAEQTNLLALNATIEAARAGDAGKGFAVVASEVKSLATQTAKATEQIAEQIKTIQDQTGSTVDAIRLINDKIEAMKEVSAAVASAIEEQNAATQEIGSNAQDASTGTRQVSESITGVTQAALEAGQGSGEVLNAAGELSRQAESLTQEVNAFITKIRAA